MATEPEKYRVLFYGETADDADRDAAATALGQRLKLNEAMLKRVMSGRKVALRSKLDQDNAFALQTELEKAGLVTHIEKMPEAPKPSGAEQTLQTPQPPVSTAPRERRVQMQATRLPMPPPVDGPDAAPHMKTELLAGQYPCPQCQGPLESKALTCRWCGLRLNEDEKTAAWWLSALGAAAVLIISTLLVLAASGMFGNAMLSSLSSSQQPEQQVATAYASTNEVQAHIRDFVGRTNFWPNSNLDAGLPEPAQLANQYLISIEVLDNATLIATLRPELEFIGGHTFRLQAQIDTQGLPVWSCSDTSLPPALAPPQCLTHVSTPLGQAAPATQSAQPTQSNQPAALSADALPPANFVKKVISEEFANTRWIRKAVIQHRNEHGDWPADNSSTGVGHAAQLGSHAVQQIQIQPNGKIAYQFSNVMEGMRGAVVILQNDSSLGLWFCKSNIPESHLPNSCQSGIR